MRNFARLILILSFCLSFKPASEHVYICNNNNTLVYHVSKTCRAILKCKHEVITVSKEEAVKKYGKRACKVCFQ